MHLQDLAHKPLNYYDPNKTKAAARAQDLTHKPLKYGLCKTKAAAQAQDLAHKPLKYDPNKTKAAAQAQERRAPHWVWKIRTPRLGVASVAFSACTEPAVSARPMVVRWSPEPRFR